MASNERGAPQHYTPNEKMSLGERLAYVLGKLADRRDELSAVLPPDITFDGFHATINQALRANPDLLDCTSTSLINACVKAAYDGLRVDGQEAAIVWEMATVKTRGQPDRREKQARYMPMYQGLVQQLLRGGLVLDCSADIIYERDRYAVIRGSNPQIIHEPLIDGNDRGSPIAVYNIATLSSGIRVSSFMTRAEVEDVQKESKSGWDSTKNEARGVWKRWWSEQWKKTVMRRHRKTLPRGRARIHDAEAQDDFPQMDHQTPHPQLTEAAMPPRPTRAALSKPAVNMPFGADFGSRNDEGDLVEQRQQQQEQRGAERQAEAPRQTAAASERVVDLPQNPTEWQSWFGWLTVTTRETITAEGLQALWLEQDPFLIAAPEPFKSDANGVLTDRAADLAAGDDDGAAAGGDDEDTAAGDRS